MSTVETLRVTVEHLAESVKELKQEVKNLQKEVSSLNLIVYEAKVGRRWLIGFLSSAVVLGTLVDTILRWFKIY